MGENKRKRGRKPKSPVADTMDLQYSNSGPTSAAADDVVAPTTDTAEAAKPNRRGRGRPRKSAKHPGGDSDAEISAASPERRGIGRFHDHNGGDGCVVGAAEGPPPRWESVAKVMPSMDAVVKVFCVHTEPNFSLPWQRKRQYSSSSSGFIIAGRRVLTNAHSVEHHTQVKLKKRGSDTKYLATVLAIGNECDIGKGL